jgi:predicted NBD/HSP70 family sugar kinase
MNVKRKYAIGVDLGGSSIKLGIVTNTGRIIKKSLSAWKRKRDQRKLYRI